MTQRLRPIGDMSSRMMWHFGVYAFAQIITAFIKEIRKAREV